MSEPRSLQAIAPVREMLRPADDLVPMHSHELARFFDAGTVAALTRAERTSRESFRPVGVPLPADPVSVVTAAAPSVALDEAPEVKPPSDRAPAVARAAEPSESADRAAPQRTGATAHAAGDEDHVAQPYGWDPVRLRELVHWFVDGRQAAAMIVAPKLAGDLLDTPSQASDPPRRIRRVDAGGRIS